MINKAILVALFALTFQALAADWSQSDSLIQAIVKEEELDPGKDNLQNYLKTNFAPLWNGRFQKYILGFIGPDYRRLKIHFTNITKNRTNEQSYSVSGCSFVNTKCDFDGNLKIAKVVSRRGPYSSCDAEKPDTIEKGILIGNYNLKENGRQSNSGIFSGTFLTKFIKTKNGRILYDTLDECSDGFWNNWFFGTWRSNSTGKSKNCNWGEFRIPLCGDLDVGTGEFYPSPRYYEFGWRSLGQRMETNDTNLIKKESKPWW